MSSVLGRAALTPGRWRACLPVTPVTITLFTGADAWVVQLHPEPLRQPEPPAAPSILRTFRIKVARGEQELAHVVEAVTTLTGTVLWDRVTVGEGAMLTDCVVADDVVIPAGARYSRSALVMEENGLSVHQWNPA